MAVCPKTRDKLYFCDKCLPFGASISCALFQKFSDALKWILDWKLKCSRRITNYLDDFLFIAWAKFIANMMVKEFINICEQINCPVAHDKTEFAMQFCVFLGILLDGQWHILVIPEEKRTKALASLNWVIHKKKVTIKQIQCLTGLLNFLNKAIIPGSAFTRRMYAKLWTDHNGKRLKHYHHVQLDSEFRADCRIWTTFLEYYQATGLCRPFIDIDKAESAEVLEFFTDASKGVTKGFGCVFKKSFTWGIWEVGYIKKYDPSIEYLEHYALCVGIFTSANQLRDTRIVVFCDNMAVVHMINDTSSSCKNCMYLIRKLMLNNLIYNRRVFAKYISTKANSRADVLSRGLIGKYFKLAPHSNKTPDPIPEELWPLSKLWLN